MQNVIIIVLIIVAVAAMVLGGWISFAEMDDSATMTIHKNEVKKDTEQAVKKGEEFVEDAAREGRKLLDNTEDAANSDEPFKGESDLNRDQSEALETPK
ncbi:hypothetical protein [Gimesia algae]|uniref:Uncharacterized protein n=1 Tax=Gimesia algae TaxID=2527971 RepID=A0A517VB44_9PLAN|nr:hypothetical protein [Gimesia algae]QDT90216.1 hypothetical protein Pan161_18660 [Gimesia algae]